MIYKASNLEIITQIALSLAVADNTYRGFDPVANPPENVDRNWYHENIDGWPWYMYMAECVITKLYGAADD